MIAKSLALSGALAAALALTGAAAAADYPKPIKAAEAAGFKIHSSFDAGDGLTGWATTGQGRGMIIYTTPGGDYALIGALLDAEGRNLTETHVEKYVPKPDYAEAWAKLDKAAWVSEGASDAGNVVYVFMEPNCGYCHLFWETSRPYVATGKVEVRHVMVSFLRETSAAKSAAILEAKDPAKALADHEAAFKSGGIEGITNPKAETISALEANNQLMQSLDIRGTPAIVYKHADGKVEILRGMPPASDFPVIFGVQPTSSASAGD